MIVKTTCGIHKKLFGIDFVQRPHGTWEASTAFAVSEKRGAGGFGSAQLEGTFILGVSYPGCPYCGNSTFYRCNNCGQLNCQGTAEVSDGTTYVACGNCGSAGYLHGQLDTLDGFEDI